MYYNIIVARPFNQVFTYESINQTLDIGQIVIVPFGKAMEVGMIMEADVGIGIVGKEGMQASLASDFSIN